MRITLYDTTSQDNQPCVAQERGATVDQPSLFATVAEIARADKRFQLIEGKGTSPAIFKGDHTLLARQDQLRKRQTPSPSCVQ